MSDAALSPEQVAVRLNISRRTVYRMIREGRLLASRVGAQWRVRAEVVENILAWKGGEDGKQEPGGVA